MAAHILLQDAGEQHGGGWESEDVSTLESFPHSNKMIKTEYGLGCPETIFSVHGKEVRVQGRISYLDWNSLLLYWLSSSPLPLVLNPMPSALHCTLFFKEIENKAKTKSRAEIFIIKLLATS